MTNTTKIEIKNMDEIMEMLSRHELIINPNNTAIIHDKDMDFSNIRLGGVDQNKVIENSNKIEKNIDELSDVSSMPKLNSLEIEQKIKDEIKSIRNDNQTVINSNKNKFK